MSSAAGVYIQATETDPAVQAEAAIRGIHQRLQSGLAELSDLMVGGADEDLVSAAAARFGGQLRRHLVATDEALYAPAAGAVETRLLVRALRAASASFNPLIDALSTATGSDSAATVAATTATAARDLQAVLSIHFTVEQSVLLPALAALPGTDLTVLATDLATLVDGGRLEQPAVVDVREIPHGQRHSRIFARFARLTPGEAFTLVNNHDPKPLRGEFEAAHPGAFTWDYLESGPEQWHIRIGRKTTDA
jgi:uncharacterized protein (DUF2249 family)